MIGMTGDERRPLFSIIVAAHDAASTVAECVDSVCAQTLGDWELIAVDDGSTDETVRVLAERHSRDRRIRVVRQPNTGTAGARNAGAALAVGEWWLFLDADDMLLPAYLESQYAFLVAHPGYDIYSCNVEMLLRDGTRRVVWSGGRRSAPFSLTAEDEARESEILLMTVLRPSVFALTGGFRPVYSEDYDFWLRALILGARHIYNPEVLAVYRRAEGSKTTRLVAAAKSTV